MKRLVIVLTTILLASCAAADDKITFEQHIKPIFRQHCQACHSQDDASSGLALDDYSATLSGGASGEVLASGDADGSRLWKLMNHEEEPVMPPGGDKIPEDQLKLVRLWIEGGLLKDANSKPKPIKKSAVAQVATDPSGKPVGEPAMPAGLFRQPVVTSEHVGPIASLAASRWAPVAVAPWQRQVSFFDTDTHQLLGIVPYVEGVPTIVRFSRDGSLLLVAGGRHGSLGTAALYDVKTGAKIAVVGDELDIILAADISPNKTMVAIGGPKKKVRAYRIADGEKVYQLGKHTDWITALAFSPDGKLLATGDRNSGLRTWDAAAGHERNDLRGHNQAITSIAWRGDGAVMASTSEDGSLRLWNAAGAQIKSSGAHGGGALSVSFSEDGRLVTAGRDRRVKLWKPDGNHLADIATMNDITLAAAFTHDDKAVIASDYAGEVRMINLEDKKTLATLTPNPPKLEELLADHQTKQAAAQQASKQATATLTHATKAVADAQAAHQAYKQQLAQSKQDAQSKRKQRDSMAGQVKKAEQALAGAQSLAKSMGEQLVSAKQNLSAYEKELETTATEVSKTDEQTPEMKKLADLKKSVVLAQAAADTASQAMQQTDAAKQHSSQQLVSANQEALNSAAHLAEVQNQQGLLPKMGVLRKAHEAAAKAAEATSGELKAATANRDALAGELDRFRKAAAALSEQAKQRAAEQTTLAGKRGGATAERDALAKQVDQQKALVDQARKQLESLQQKLRTLQQKQQELASKLDQRDAKLAEVEKQFAETQRAAQTAEALLRDFAAAQALREAYAEQE